MIAPHPFLGEMTAQLEETRVILANELIKELPELANSQIYLTKVLSETSGILYSPLSQSCYLIKLNENTSILEKDVLVVIATDWVEQNTGLAFSYEQLADAKIYRHKYDEYEEEGIPKIYCEFTLICFIPDFYPGVNQRMRWYLVYREDELGEGIFQIEPPGVILTSVYYPPDKEG